jgi:hypothetical protein
VEPTVARALWHRLENLNAVAYFCAECREAPEQLGLRGFWMGYFACRAAPMGPVGPGVVEATFANFHPRRVRAAIPAAWQHATATEVIDARSAAAASALRRLLGGDSAEALAASVVDPLRRAIEAATAAGRPLYAANREVPPPADPVAGLWQAATTLREHRGDGHVAVLTSEDLDGCEAHVLFSAAEGISAELYLRSRGWSEDDWSEARDRLAGRGLLTGDGKVTSVGRQLRDHIERRTDELSMSAYRRLGDDGVAQLLLALTPAAARVAGSGEVMFPNPMGLPRVVHDA